MNLEARYRLDRLRSAGYTMLIGILATIGAYHIGSSDSEAQPKHRESFTLTCDGLGPVFERTVRPAHPVSVKVKTQYNATGSVSLRFLESESDGQLYVDFGDRENLQMDKNELVGHPDGVRQTIQVSRDRLASLVLFATPDVVSGQPEAYVSAECLSQQQFDDLEKSADNTFVPKIVPQVPDY